VKIIFYQIDGHGIAVIMYVKMMKASSLYFKILVRLYAVVFSSALSGHFLFYLRLGFSVF
jgi:hypothetical protein